MVRPLGTEAASGINGPGSIEWRPATGFVNSILRSGGVDSAASCRFGFAQHEAVTQVGKSCVLGTTKIVDHLAVEFGIGSSGEIARPDAAESAVRDFEGGRDGSLCRTGVDRFLDTEA